MGMIIRHNWGGIYKKIANMAVYRSSEEPPEAPNKLPQ